MPRETRQEILLADLLSQIAQGFGQQPEADIDRKKRSLDELLDGPETNPEETHKLLDDIITLKSNAAGAAVIVDALQGAIDSIQEGIYEGTIKSEGTMIDLEDLLPVRHEPPAITRKEPPRVSLPQAEVQAPPEVEPSIPEQVILYPNLGLLVTGAEEPVRVDSRSVPKVQTLLTIISRADEPIPTREIMNQEKAGKNFSQAYQVRDTIQVVRRLLADSTKEVLQYCPGKGYCLNTSFQVASVAMEASFARSLQKQETQFSTRRAGEIVGRSPTQIRNWIKAGLLKEGVHFDASETQPNYRTFGPDGMKRLRQLVATREYLIRTRGISHVRHQTLAREISRQQGRAVSIPQAAETTGLTQAKVRDLCRTSQQNPKGAEAIFEEGIHFHDTSKPDAQRKAIRITPLGIRTLEKVSSLVSQGKRLGATRILDQLKEPKRKPVEARAETVEFGKTETAKLAGMLSQRLDLLAKRHNLLIDENPLAEIRQIWQSFQESGATIEDCQELVGVLERKVQSLLASPAEHLPRFAGNLPVHTILSVLSKLDLTNREKMVMTIFRPSIVIAPEKGGHGTVKAEIQ